MDKLDTIKKGLLQSLTKSKGMISTACKLSNISRSQFYNYFNADADFREQVREIKEIAIDAVEAKLLDKVDEGDTTAIIFYLKTIGRKRGYSEKQTLADVFQSLPFSDIDVSMLSPEAIKELALATNKIQIAIQTPAKGKPDWLL